MLNTEKEVVVEVIDRLQELAGLEEDAYASEKAKGLFIQANVNVQKLEELFQDDSFLHRHTKRAGGDTKEFDLVYKSIQHLKATIAHAEEAAHIPDESHRRSKDSW